jgi:glycosyltransferase involved in cell wall biosynthesis
MIEITVYTPTYNRANTLNRVFSSLKKQTYRNFEWVVIDDGSQDDTKNIVHSFIEDADFPIRYFHQQNLGKHVATNRALKMAQGELFLIADSDDSFKEDALQILVGAWYGIPADKRDEYKGVACRCYDPENNEPLGSEFPRPYFDSNDIDILFKHKYTSEYWGILNTKVCREFLFPEEKGIHFYPESIIWNNMARTYKNRFINDSLRAYFRDQDNATTQKRRTNANENIFLWIHYTNEMLDYFFFDITRFCKAFVGLSRDGLIIGNSYYEIMKLCKGFWRKVLITLFYPVGYSLYLFNKTQSNHSQPEKRG